MPAPPPELSEWLMPLLQPAVILAGVGLIVNQLGKRIDDLKDSVNKRIDDPGKQIDNLREGRKGTRKEVKELHDERCKTSR